MTKEEKVLLATLEKLEADGIILNETGKVNLAFLIAYKMNENFKNKVLDSIYNEVKNNI